MILKKMNRQASTLYFISENKTKNTQNTLKHTKNWFTMR